MGTRHGTSRDRQEAMRKYMGYALTYANKMNLAAMTPRSDLASTSTAWPIRERSIWFISPRRAKRFPWN